MFLGRSGERGAGSLELGAGSRHHVVAGPQACAPSAGLEHFFLAFLRLFRISSYVIGIFLAPRSRVHKGICFYAGEAKGWFFRGEER